MTDDERIKLAHGGGGQLTAELIEQVILPAIGGQDPASLTDAATLQAGGGGKKLAFTTDSYVVKPLEFPGGDIGKLAVCGTINDLSVAGSKPIALSLSLIIAEGFEIELLRRLLASAGVAAAGAGVKIVTGDTKVVQRDACDGLMINTSGLGQMLDGADLGFDRIQPGDRIILSGPLGEHGLAIMAKREGLGFSTNLQSDCAALDKLTASLIDNLQGCVKFMRDPTRGGLAASLVEISNSSGCDIQIDQQAIPINTSADTAAQILGLDLLTIANEGKLVAVVSPDAAEQAESILRKHPIASKAAIIGKVGPREGRPLVEMTTPAGGKRIVQLPYGEDLPRIC